jgi:radical SAM protein with 4Fe4S-binding SPASM domain
MEFKLFTKAIDELLEANSDYFEKEPVWLHHFGESLLHPEFARFIRYASGKGIHTCLSINPIMLKPDVALELVSSGLYMLYISLDGHDDESFDQIRGMKNAYGASHDRVIDFLTLIKQCNCGTRIILSMIDFLLNEKSIVKIRDYWESMEGINQFLLKGFSTWDGSALDVRKLAKDPGGFQKSDKVECPFPWERMTILWDGIVVPCCNDYDKKLILGNIAEQKLAEIWNGKAMQALRKEFIANDVRNRLCRHCAKLRLPREMVQW